MKPRLKKKRRGSPRKTRAPKIIPETSRHFPRFWLIGMVSLVLFTHAYTTLTGAWSTLSLVDSQTAFLIGVLESFLLPFIGGLFMVKLAVWIHDKPTEANWYSDPGILD
jgi:hypothetical protein